MTVRRVFVGVAILVLSSCADTRTCTIQLPLSTPLAEFPHLAQVSRAAAESAARDRLHTGPLARILTSDLKSENGCLIWSVELRAPGEPGTAQIRVDAGDGHILSVRNESNKSWFYE